MSNYFTVLAPPPEMNPLDNWKLTIDHFYQHVKAAAGASATQYIQIRSAAEPLEMSEQYPWFSYYGFLSKADIRASPTPITADATPDSVSMVEGQLSYEYGRFLKEAVRLVERKELPNDVNEKINLLEKKNDNIDTEVDSLVEKDSTRWAVYCQKTGASPADRAAYNQWAHRFGNANRIEAVLTEKRDNETEIAALRLDKFKDEDQEELFKQFAAWSNVGARLRWPRLPDTMYKEAPFTASYLQELPTGSTALFADRHFVYPQGITLKTITTGGQGAVKDIFKSDSRSTDSISRDWNGSASAGYLWFRASVAASEHTKIREDFKNTSSLSISTQSILSVKFDNTPWFSSDIFKNSYIAKNPQIFTRFFGKEGTLRYYPVSVLLVRGMKLEFEATSDYQYDYEHTFSASGSGALRIFGVSFGGGGGYSERQEKQVVKKQGHTLVLDDGAANVRVIGYVLNKVTVLDSALYGAVEKSMESARTSFGGASRG